MRGIGDVLLHVAPGRAVSVRELGGLPWTDLFWLALAGLAWPRPAYPALMACSASRASGLGRIRRLAQVEEMIGFERQLRTERCFVASRHRPGANAWDAVKWVSHGKRRFINVTQRC